MAARKWTLEQRKKQAEIIHRWKPWEQSTGATTPEGKVIASRNAFRFTQRKAYRFAVWLLKQKNKLMNSGQCASIEEMELEASRVSKSYTANDDSA